ncbi:hypothetical protein HYV69_01015, partial [Candidatus Uhrbacteria bacterium]|nr:hypothetical protein [Candidatus Uhrbacteria bacterium]
MNLKIQNKRISIITIVSMLAMVISWVVLPVHAASPPNILTYQGRVLDANGVPVSSSSASMKFFLYSSLSGGTCIWSNSSSTCDGNTPGSTTARTVTLTNGLFTENLGDTSIASPYAAISDSTFADNTGIYLEVIIAGETLTPRKQLVAAPYALNADTLDGIDLSVIQLWEVGTNGSYEDDAAAIVGADTAFSYGSGGVGDLRVADEIEVMGDGFIDNDLVVGASTSATETIANVAFSLSGNDLFVASDAGIEGNLYVDGAIDLVGTATVSDLSCVDCLDFTELSDTLALDTSTSITQDSAEVFTITNSGTGNTIVNLSSTGDFIVQDNGVAAFTVNDSGNGTFAGTLGVTGNTTLTGDLAVNGGDLTSTATTWNIDVGNTGSFIFRDGTNTLFSITDAGTTGNASITGTLGVTGAVTLTDDLAVNGDDVLAVNGDDVTSDGNLSLSATGYTRVGDTGVPGDATADDSLYVEGAFEVDGTAYFDSTLTIDANNIDGTNFDVTGSTGAVSAAAGAFDIDSSGNITDGGNVLIDPSSRVDANAAGALSFGTTTATSLAFGSASVTAITITTDANASNDVSLTGGVSTTRDVTVGTDLTVTSGQRIGTGSVPDNLVALADDSLFVEGTAEIDGGLYVDGAVDFDSSLDVAGTATVGDISCVDCLDFTELSDTLALDTSTSITQDGVEAFTITNSGTGDTVVNLSSSGDFIVQDNGVAAFTLNDSGNGTFAGTLGVTGAVTLTDDLAVNGDDVTSDGNLSLSATGYTRVGDTGVPGDATADDSLYVEGAFEV